MLRRSTDFASFDFCGGRLTAKIDRRQSNDGRPAMDMTTRLNVAVLFAALLFVGAIVIGVF
jgi:hypothetical protein